MKFQVNQKVSFLNEARTGIIKRIINSQMVQVETEEGFEYPVMISDLVAYEPMYKTYDNVENENTTIYNKYTKSKEVDIEIEDEDEENEEIPRKSLINMSAQNEIEKGFHIALAPEENDINADFFYIYFVNNSDYDAHFTYALKNEENTYIDKDVEDAPSKSKVILDVISRTQFNEWSDIYFQILSFSADTKTILKPLAEEISFPPIKILKGNNFKYYSIIEETAWIKTLGRQEKAPSEKPVQKNNLKIIGHINEIKNQESIPEKHIVAKDFAEIDLHIDELLDNLEGLTNTQMLTTQINYFQKMMNCAISNHYKRIIFIHGIGNGKLKNSIREILKKDYPFVEIFDASMAKYGAGATEIRIPTNKPS